MITLVWLFLVCAQLQGQSYIIEQNKLLTRPSIRQKPSWVIKWILNTRHDQIVAYLAYLAKTSNKAQISYYGETREEKTANFSN